MAMGREPKVREKFLCPDDGSTNSWKIMLSYHRLPSLKGIGFKNRNFGEFSLGKKV
jgi:hypothetical protein